MILSLRQMSILSGIKLSKIIAGTYEPNELARLLNIDWQAANMLRERAAAEDPEAYDRAHALLRAYLSNPESRTYNLRVSNRELQDKYLVWLSPNKYIIMEKGYGMPDPIHLIYDSQAFDFYASRRYNNV